MSYTAGQLVRLRASFTNPENNNELTTPSAVLLKILHPNGTETSVTPSSEGTGKFFYDLPLDKAGRWVYRFESSGTYQAAKEKALLVSSSSFDA